MGFECTTKNTNSLIPSDIVTIRILCTGMAWDNFDIYIQTLSGAGTIHHTYGICYQNEFVDLHMTDELEQTTAATVKAGSKRKKRLMKVVEPQNTNDTILEPYRKKLRHLTRKTLWLLTRSLNASN